MAPISCADEAAKRMTEGFQSAIAVKNLDTVKPVQYMLGDGAAGFLRQSCRRIQQLLSISYAPPMRNRDRIDSGLDLPGLRIPKGGFR